jgi:DinB superfamily
MATTQLEPWLRGPLPGIHPLLQPVAHAFVMAAEDVAAAVEGLSPIEVWTAPYGVTPVGFHVAHLSGSTDRLLTYARGAGLDEAQKAALGRERMMAVERPPIAQMVADWQATVERALVQLAITDPASLTDAREVGRDRLPSTVLGLLFHAAEHASRHTGQVVATAKLVRAATAAG